MLWSEKNNAVFLIHLCTITNSLLNFKPPLLFIPERKTNNERLAYVVDQSGFVSVLDDFHGSDSAPSVQGEALAPAGNAVWVDPFPDSHRAPGVKVSRETVKHGSCGNKVEMAVGTLT